MGIADRVGKLAQKAQDAAVEHREQVQHAIEKAAVLADEKTAGKYSERIEAAGAKAEGLLDKGIHYGQGSASAPAPDAVAAQEPEADAGAPADAGPVAGAAPVGGADEQTGPHFAD